MSKKHPKLDAEPTDVEKLFSTIDIDNDGFIDKDEFVKMSSASFEVSALSVWLRSLRLVAVPQGTDVQREAASRLRDLLLKCENPPQGLTEISQFLLPALAQPGVNTTTIFAPNQPRDWIYWLKEWQLQLEYDAMDAYDAGDHVALLGVAMYRVIATLEDIESWDNTVPVLEDAESDSDDSQETIVPSTP